MRASPTLPSMRNPPAGISNTSFMVSPRTCTALVTLASPKLALTI
jgi:hypothetical protein